MCQRCHSLIHEGLLQVEGTAPHGLRWYGAGGEPLQASDGCPLHGGSQGGSSRYRTEARGDAPHDIQSDSARAGEAAVVEEAEDTTIHSLDEVPDEITREWRRKYGHNFCFKGNRMMLKKTL